MLPNLVLALYAAMCIDSEVDVFLIEEKNVTTPGVRIPSERIELPDNFNTIEVRVHFGASGCIRVQFVLSFALVNKNWTQGTTKTTWQLIKLYTTKFLAILLGGKVIEGIGRALLVEEDHIIIDFLSDRLITGHV